MTDSAAPCRRGSLRRRGLVGTRHRGREPRGLLPAAIVSWRSPLLDSLRMPVLPTYGRGGGEVEAGANLKRDVAVLALGLVDALGLEHPQGADQLRPGLARLDHVVDVAAFGRRIGICEMGLVVVDQLLAAL